MELNSTIVRMKAMVKPTNQRRLVGRLSTVALILSVTLVKVWPGAMIWSGLAPSCGGGASCSAMSVGLLRGQLGVGVAHGGQVEGPRPGAQFAQEVVVQVVL